MRRKNSDVKIVNGYEIKPNADLNQADLRYTELAGVHLEGANLEYAELNGANLEGAHLEGANLERADLTDAHLDGAYLEDANLERAILEGARLGYAHLGGANLKDANLKNAILEDAYLEGAILNKTILIGAILNRARLEGAHLEGAYLSGARLEGALLPNAHLEGAFLDGANLEDAHLEGANLKDASLRDAYLVDADFTNADLSGADIVNTDLFNAILTDTNFSGARYDRYTEFPPDFDMRRLLPAIEDRRSYGEMTGSVLKLGKPDSPPRAADFKRKYPLEFDRLIKDTGGKDFTDSVKEDIRNKYRTPFDWYVSRGKYRKKGFGSQRESHKPNDVIMINIDLEKIDATEKQIELIEKLAEVSRMSGHPYASYPLFTIGWVRFDTDEARKLYLVEEVQSDVWVVRQQTKNVDEQTRNQLEKAEISPEDFDEIFEVIRPYADRFYEDALGILFMEAEEKGYSVEMLGYGDKKKYGSPRSIYTDLPRKMGMRPQPTQTDLELKDKVSYYKPNPSRPRRRY